MKVLHVNMNVIMASCIKLYINDVNMALRPSESWGYLNQVKHIDEFIDYDANELKLIQKSVLNQFTRNHYPKVKMVSNVYEMATDIVLDKESTNIINIDMIHGCQSCDNGRVVNNSTWLDYLATIGCAINEIEWLHPINAEIIGFPNNNEKIKITETRFNELYFSDVDIIYIDTADLFVPYKYKNLAELILDSTKYLSSINTTDEEVSTPEVITKEEVPESNNVIEPITSEPVQDETIPLAERLNECNMYPKSVDSDKKNKTGKKKKGM